MFNKSERQELNALSLKVYGTETAWVKLLNDPKYQIVTGKREESGQKYVQYQTKDGKPGTVITLEKAIEKYGFQATDEQLSRPIVITESRQATFEEMKTALTAALEMAIHSQLSIEERQHVFAHMFASGKLVYRLSLELPDSEQTKAAFEEQLSFLSDDQKERVKEMLTSADKKVEGIPVDAYGFVSDAVFCKNHEEKAAELTYDYLAEAAKKVSSPKKASLNQDLQKKLYSQAVNKAKREHNKKLTEKQRVKNEGPKKGTGRNSRLSGEATEGHVGNEPSKEQ